MNTKIVPAVMPRNWRGLEGAVRDVVGAVALVQVDIMDGVFVGSRTWPYPKKSDWMQLAEKEGLPFWEEVDYELDLMIAAPEETLVEWGALGPAQLVIHYESVRNWEALRSVMAPFREYIQFGLSFDDETPWGEVAKQMDGFSYVQCMGIDEIGAQGNAFSERVLSNIAAVQETHPGILITVDGSVNRETIQSLDMAGAGRFVAGSAIYGTDNPRTAIEGLASLLQ